MTIISMEIQPSEHQEQCAVVEWFRLQFPDVRILAIPNGAYLAGGKIHSARQMQRMKKEGVSPGVPDLYVPAWRLWIEMKRTKGGRLSGAQRGWIDYLASIGDRVILARGFDEARAEIMRASRP